jgi:hypothetical protein
MKLPSITYLVSNAKESLTRFPLTILSSFIAVAVGIYLTECGKDISNIFPYINVLLCMALGIPLYFCAVVLSGKMGLSKKNNAYLMLAASCILICIFFTLPDSESTHNTTLPYIKYGIYNITIHLFVSFLPFIFSRQLNGFWQYNKILFIRVWASVLYSGVLYLGLALALIALKLLFDIDLHNELFFEFFIVIGGLFNTWFFVSGIPKDFDKLEDIAEYPKGLKIFSQYILLPLLTLYLVILYFYGGKILMQWNWPKGIVSYLIICISVLGILTFLLLHPYGNLSGNSWIKKISKAYYLALFPLLIILFIAIFMRVSDYGITINRYVIILLGIWLTVVCIYTSIGKTNIKFIPASLAVMLLLMSFGPWGMFSVSERNQVNRLKSILEKGGILESGKIKHEAIWELDSTLRSLRPTKENLNEGRLNDSLHNEVKSILEYLDNHHGFNSIRGWYVQDIDSIVTKMNFDEKKWDRKGEAYIYMRAMGLKPEHKFENESRDYFNYRAAATTLKKVTGYDYVVGFYFSGYSHDKTITTFHLDSVDYSFHYEFNKNEGIQLHYGDKKLNLQFINFITALHKKYGFETKSEIPLSNMDLKASTDKYDFTIEFHSIEMRLKSGSYVLNSFSGDIFIKAKRAGD